MKVEEKHLATSGNDSDWYGLDRTAVTRDADTTYNSPKLDGLNFNSVAVQVVWTGVNTTDPVAKLQESVDGDNWEDVSGESVTFSTAAGNGVLKMADFASRFVRVAYDKGTATAGTFTLRAVLKTK